MGGGRSASPPMHSLQGIPDVDLEVFCCCCCCCCCWWLWWWWCVLGATVVVRVRAGGGHRKMKKSWRGAGGEGAAPPPQCTRCRCWLGGCCCCCCCCGWWLLLLLLLVLSLLFSWLLSLLLLLLLLLPIWRSFVVVVVVVVVAAADLEVLCRGCCCCCCCRCRCCSCSCSCSCCCCCCCSCCCCCCCCCLLLLLLLSSVVVVCCCCCVVARRWRNSQKVAQWPEGGAMARRWRNGQKVARRAKGRKGQNVEKKLLFPSVLQQLLKNKKLQFLGHKRFVDGAMARRWRNGQKVARRARGCKGQNVKKNCFFPVFCNNCWRVKNCNLSVISVLSQELPCWWRNGQKMAQWPEGGTQGQRAQRPECEISLSKWLIRLKISSIQTTFLWGNLPPQKKKCNIHTAKLICAALKPPCLVEEISRAIQNLQSNKQRILLNEHMSYGQNLVHGERTSLSRVGPYRFCSGGTLYKPSWGYRFRVGPYRFCSDGYPTTLSILLWSYLILSDTHITAPAVPAAVLLEECCQGRSKKQGGGVKKKRVGGLEKQGGGLKEQGGGLEKSVGTVKKKGGGSNKQVVGGQKKGVSKKKVWGVKKNGRG